MTDPSLKSKALTLPTSSAFICSPESRDGNLGSNSQRGQQADLFLQAHAPARRSRQPASALRVRHAMAGTLCGALDELASQYAQTAATHGLPMPATFGRSFGGSSPSDGLAQSLASRLLASRALSGSPEYAVVWKSSAMLLGAPIFRLVASARPISGNGCSGWPTPMVNDEKGSTHCYGPKREDGTRPHFLKLPGAAALTGWPSPNHNTTGAGHQGRAGGLNLQTAAQLAGWPTPMAGSPATETYNEAGNTDSSRKTTALVGWATPRREDSESTGAHRGKPDTLSSQARLSGWATPTSRGHKDGSTDLEKAGVPINGLLGRQVSLVSGPGTTLPTAQTGERGALNPAHSRWLLGFGTEWDDCAPTETRSRRR